MPSYIVRDPNTGKRYRVRQSNESQVQPIASQEEEFSLGKGARQIAVGFSGGQSGGLTDVLANKAGIPESFMRNVGGVAGMLTPTPVNIPLRTMKLAGLAAKGISKASLLGRMAVRAVEGAMGAGASQLGEAVEERSINPVLRSMMLGGAVGSVIPPLGVIAKGVPYTRLFGGGKRFASALKKSPVTVDLTDEAETLARIRHGVNPAVRKDVLSQAEQTYKNLTGRTPVEDLLNARGQVGVAQAHEVGNLANQNLAKSFAEMWGEALRGGNKLKQLGLKSGINRKIQAADPSLKELFQNYTIGQNINEVASNLNPLGLPLKLIRALRGRR